MSAAELAQRLRDGAVPGLKNSKGMPSEDFRNGWEKGHQEGQKFGYERGLRNGGLVIANEMRVLLCALIAAHKRCDDGAFSSTVVMAQRSLSVHVNFSDEDWNLFRCDAPRNGAP